MSVVVICQRLFEEVVCTHRSGIRLCPPQTHVVKRVVCLICDQVEEAFLMRVSLLLRRVFFFFYM